MKSGADPSYPELREGASYLDRGRRKSVALKVTHALTISSHDAAAGEAIFLLGQGGN